MSEEGCEGCKYFDLDDYSYPCKVCSRSQQPLKDHYTPKEDREMKNE